MALLVCLFDIILTHNKSQYARKADGTPNILIDDFGKNIKGWESAGGIGIKYENNAPALTLKKLENIFKKKLEYSNKNQPYN